MNRIVIVASPPHMNRQIGGSRISFTANFTEICHCASVSSRMNGQITSRCARSSTSRTQKLLLFFGDSVQRITRIAIEVSMSSHVNFKMIDVLHLFSWIKQNQNIRYKSLQRFAFHKYQPQTGHLKRSCLVLLFSCTILCRSKFFGLTKDLLQIWHTFRGWEDLLLVFFSSSNSVSSALSFWSCVFICSKNASLQAYSIWHSGQLSDLKWRVLLVYWIF